MNSVDEQLVDESYLVVDVIGREPAWIVRFGIAIVFFVVAALFALASMIRYPDLIRARITLTTAQPPVPLVSEVGGRIVEFAVTQGQTVAPGQVLAVLDSAVDQAQLGALEDALEPLRTRLQRQLSDPTERLRFEPIFSGLGPLQKPVNELADAVQAYVAALTTEQRSVRDGSAETMRRRYSAMKESLLQKRELLARKIDLQTERLNRNASLAERGLVGRVELMPLESQLLDQRLSMDDIDIQLESYNIKLEEMDRETAEYRVQHEEALQQLLDEVRLRLRQLDADIAVWKRDYRIVAPIAGRVSVARFWSTNQYVERGDVVLTVDAQSEHLLGKLTVDHEGAGKIVPGQRVEIDLDGYPAVEYGTIAATVTHISPIPSADGYAVDIAISAPLRTSHGRQIAFTPNLLGSARIITNDRALLERFLANLLYATGLS